MGLSMDPPITTPTQQVTELENYANQIADPQAPSMFNLEVVQGYLDMTQGDHSIIAADIPEDRDPGVPLLDLSGDDLGYLSRVFTSSGSSQHRAFNPLGEEADTVAGYTPFETSIAGGAYFLEYQLNENPNFLTGGDIPDEHEPDLTVRQNTLDGMAVNAAIHQKSMALAEHEKRYITHADIATADRDGNGILTVSETNAIPVKLATYLPMIAR